MTRRSAAEETERPTAGVPIPAPDPDLFHDYVTDFAQRTYECRCQRS